MPLNKMPGDGLIPIVPPIRAVYEYDELDSTNRMARTLLLQAEKNAVSASAISTLPFLVTARIQTAGRGRGTHRWWSPEGGLFLTAAARWSDFALSRGESVEISLKTAQSVAETISEMIAETIKNAGGEFRVTVKPPNDVYLNGKKIAGILIESPLPEYLLIGIGINLNNRPEQAPEDVRSLLTSLIAETGIEIDRSRFVQQLVNKLFQK